MKSDSKVLLFSFLVLVLIFVFSFMMKSFLQHSAEKLNKDIESIESYIKNNNWDNAEELVQKLNNDWSKYEDKWSLFINHHEIDNISTSLDYASQYIENKDAEFSYAYLSVLKHYIDHIPEMENISLKNIF